VGGFLVVAAATMTIAACRKKSEDDTSDVRAERSEPSVPISATPVEPAVMGATDFCRMIYEAPVRALEQRCSEAERITKAYAALSGTARERVQQCWQMLAADVQARRLTLPTSAAKRCAAAIAKQPWKHALFRMAITELSECRNLTIGTQTAGQACRTSAACRPGFHCDGAKPDADGACTKKAAAGDGCAAPPWRLLGELDAGCDTGLFCDHGLSAADVESPSIPAPSEEPVPGGPRVRGGKTRVAGSLPPEVVQRIIRASFGSVRSCYEAGLASNPSLAGKVTVRFVIARDGSVSTVAADSQDLGDQGVIDCISRAFYTLSFPAPSGGVVTVRYPIKLTPADADPKPERSSPRATNQCSASRKEGDPCAHARECDPGLACREGKCGKPAGERERCLSSSDCAAPLFCGAVESPRDAPPSADAGAGGSPDDGDDDEASAPPERACTAPKAAGESCSDHDECAGACVEGTCKPFCGG
jgi:hypothetical protein